MRKVAIGALALALAGPASAALPEGIQKVRATTCFKTGENAPPMSMYKDCYYNCLGSQVTISIKSTSLCPLTIQR